MKTLKKFLKNDNAPREIIIFAKDLTLEQFLATCEQGDWILWLFERTNPNSLTELTLAKALCANTVRHLMKDERSKKVIDIAIEFGNGRATRQELDAARRAYYAAYFYYRRLRSLLRLREGVYYEAAAFAVYARKANQKQTANICREYLPLSIWDQSKF